MHSPAYSPSLSAANYSHRSPNYSPSTIHPTGVGVPAGAVPGGANVNPPKQGYSPSYSPSSAVFNKSPSYNQHTPHNISKHSPKYTSEHSPYSPSHMGSGSGPHMGSGTGGASSGNMQGGSSSGPGQMPLPQNAYIPSSTTAYNPASPVYKQEDDEEE